MTHAEHAIDPGRRRRIGVYGSALIGLMMLVVVACWPAARSYGQTDRQFDPPIVITAGGTYRGSWESQDATTPAVLIRTSEPVVIEHSFIRSRGHLIRSDHGFDVDLIVRYVYGEALVPNVEGRAPGRFVSADTYRQVTVERSTMVGTAGIYLYRSTEGASARIVGNRALNIDGRVADGAGGFDTSQRGDLVQFVQFNAGNALRGTEVAWNEVINEPFVSRVEDIVSLFATTGAPDDPIRIHNNFLQGAYPLDPAEDGFSGGGIMLGDGGGGHQQAYMNQVVATSNYGIAISGGHDQHVFDNRVVSCGVLPDGRPIASQNVGIYVTTRQGDPADSVKRGSGNLIAWAHPRLIRNDYWVPAASEWSHNVSLVVGRTVTCDREAHEYEYWQRKLAAAGMAIGANRALMAETP